VREGLSRPLWLALVVVLFCLPLFVGLGRTDLRNDEAIYSYSVDSILELGDWGGPRSSPNEEIHFFEKPPLKFWIVAAPIRAGLLPHNEFGLRFWDIVFSGIAFLYVFAIGQRVAGPICGTAAVLILFVHGPLLLQHGLRENNMEAPLLLAYCGGVYHYFRSVDAGTSRLGARHRIAVGLYFVLGFLTKFVAALFLPLILGVATLLIAPYRTRLRDDWRQWMWVGLLAWLLIAPWYVYAHIRFGNQLWEVMFRDHVYYRFTASVDPRHLHPWYYYFDQIYRGLKYSGSFTLTWVGSALFIVQTVRWRWPEGILLIIWFVLPLALMSFGTSKLYHYAYPLLPPVAIAAGYLPAFIWQTVRPRTGAAVPAVERWLNMRAPSVIAFSRRPAVRRVLLTLAALSVVIVIVTLIRGPFRIEVGGVTLFRNSSVLRPGLLGFAFGVLAGGSRSLSLVLIPLVVSVLPLSYYPLMLQDFAVERHPLRSARDCLQRVESQIGGTPRGISVDMPEPLFQHGFYYYFRKLKPWQRSETPQPTLLYEWLFVPGKQRPVLIDERWYREFRQRLATGDDAMIGAIAQRVSEDPQSIRAHGAEQSVPMVSFRDVLLLLPGAYAACAEGVGEAAGPR
jgi:4-amino-4-deoxy-L-arabinose transferase-like glycosyltransferase